MNFGDALDLAARGKSLVETFIAKVPDLFGPWGQSIAPALNAGVVRFAVRGAQVGANADESFERDRFGDHVSGVAPGFIPDLGGCFQEIPNPRVIFFSGRFVGPFLFDFVPVLFDPAMDFVEELGLENPFFLFAAAAQSIDAITQRAVAFA